MHNKKKTKKYQIYTTTTRYSARDYHLPSNPQPLPCNIIHFPVIKPV